MAEPTTPEPQGDPGHLLPEDVWAKVVADAEKPRRMAAPKAATGIITKTIPAYAHGGAISGPTLIVVHDAETPLKAGYATSLATNWFGTSAAGTSAHAIADPVDLIEMLPDDTVAWHVGPNGNAFTLGIEQAGYARFSRAEWTTADGMAQMARVGAWVRAKALAHGIPLRWATDDQIRAAARGVPGGVCHHDDIRRVLGGTTHVDPMPDYPDDLLAQAWGDAPTPQPVEDTEMRLIQSPGRGIAVVGPGYFRGLNKEELPIAVGMYGNPYVTNDRGFDLAKAINVQGVTLTPAAVAAAVVAALPPGDGSPVDVDALASKVVDDLLSHLK